MADQIWRLPLMFSLTFLGYRGRARVLAAFTAIAVAISVSLAVSLEVTSRSVDAEFARQSPYGERIAHGLLGFRSWQA